MFERQIDSIPWIEKYRPTRLNDMVQGKNLMDLFHNTIITGEMTHYLFYGPPGTGKTSAILAIGKEIFKEHYRSRVIEFNASDDRGINAVRDKITNEARKYVSEIINADGTKIPGYKIIILDEADSMTDEAQDALRVIIEKHSSVTRFCFICNYISKITNAIKSRCSAVYFKKLSIDCMVTKLKEISIKESMELKKSILNIIIDVSNGDMRKAIMMLQNLKYLYDYKASSLKTIDKMTLNELKYLPLIDTNYKSSEVICDSDIYDIAASVSVQTANSFINETIQCQNIIEVSNISKKIIAMGYPIDNILVQINKAILITDKFSDKEKAKIILYSGQIFLKMKNCANEYIQLTDYLACIYGIKKGYTMYDIK